jgi:membrane fusion protein (multidrug efflux system)
VKCIVIPGGLGVLQELTAAALAAAVLALSTGCGSEKTQSTGSANRTEEPVSVVVAPVAQKTVPIYSEMTARTDASDSIDIRARVKAFLKTQNYTEGTMVRAGQVLFTLDSREYEAHLMQAKAQMSKAQADLAQAEDKTMVETAQANVGIAVAHLNKTNQDVKRLKPLAEQRAVPQQDYDNALAAQQAATADLEGKQSSLNTAKVNQKAAIEQARASIEAAKANIRQAELDVEYCTITTPITGLAGKRIVAPGNLVGNGEATVLTTVSKINPMRVYVSISEAEYLKYQRMKAVGQLKGNKANLTLVLADGSTFPEKGRIIIADRAVDVKTGTLSLIAEFPNPKGVLRPGQFGRVRVALTEAENALLVPQKAVTEMQSAKIVYVIGEGDKVALRSVILGDRVGSDYIVTEGLKASDRVIVEGLQKVRPGDVVKPVQKPLTAETASLRKGQ